MFEFFSGKKNLRKEKNPKINETLEDQMNINGRRTDVSTDDFVEELNEISINRRDMGEAGPVMEETSWEEALRDEELPEKLTELKTKYEILLEAINNKQIDVNELRYSRSSTEKSAKNLELNPSQLVGVGELVKTAEERILRLSKMIRSGEGELFSLNKELEDLSRMIKSIEVLANDPEKTEGKKVGDSQGYNYTQN